MIRKTISTTELKSGAGEFVNAARLRGDCYVIAQRGKEGAALVPLHVLESYERNRARAGEIMESVAEANRGEDPQAIQEAIDRAVEQSRAESRTELRAGSRDGRRTAGPRDLSE